VSSAPGGGRRRLDLHQRELRVVEKNAAGGGQLNAPSTPGHELGADFQL
jgi:hypothetical protein